MSAPHLRAHALEIDPARKAWERVSARLDDAAQRRVIHAIGREVGRAVDDQGDQLYHEIAPWSPG